MKRFYNTIRLMLINTIILMLINNIILMLINNIILMLLLGSRIIRIKQNNSRNYCKPKINHTMQKIK